MSRKPHQIERYAECRRLRLCVDCRAGLEDARIRCVECRERQATSDAKRPKRAILTLAGRRRSNARCVEVYQAHKLAGLYVAPSCHEPALEDNVRCEPYRDIARASSLKCQRKRNSSSITGDKSGAVISVEQTERQGA